MAHCITLHLPIKCWVSRLQAHASFGGRNTFPNAGRCITLSRYASVFGCFSSVMNPSHLATNRACPATISARSLCGSARIHVQRKASRHGLCPRSARQGRGGHTSGYTWQMLRCDLSSHKCTSRVYDAPLSPSPGAAEPKYVACYRLEHSTRVHSAYKANVPLAHTCSREL